MKKLFQQSIGICVAMFMFSCEPQPFEIEDSEQYSRVFMQLAGEGVIEHSYNIADEWHSLSFGAGYGGFNELDRDVEVTFEIRPDLVEEYNNTNGTDFRVAPEDSYRLAQNSVTIPVGSTGSNSISLEVNPLNFQGTTALLIPVTIATVSGDVNINEELQTAYFAVNGVYGENPYELLPRDNWSVVEVSSQSTDGLGPWAIDGDFSTFWHSEWRRDGDGQRPQHPHHIVIDMNESETLHGLHIYGRQRTGSQSQQYYLFPNLVHIEVSDDGDTWESAGVFTTTFEDDDKPDYVIYFEQSVSARFFRITIASSHSNNGDTTALSEIEAF